MHVSHVSSFIVRFLLFDFLAVSLGHKSRKFDFMVLVQVEITGKKRVA